MATYFPPSSDQRDATTMLYLRDPLNTNYSESPGNNMMYMNFSSTSGSYSDALPSESHHMEINSVGASDSNTSQEVLLNFGGPRAVEHMLMTNSADEASDVFHCAPNFHTQGLSLSLSTNVPSVMQISPLQYQNLHQNFSLDDGKNASNEDGEDFRNKQLRDDNCMLSSIPGTSSNAMMSDVPPYGMPSVARAVPSSRYLKAAQQLLDEIVNVKKAIREQNAKNQLMKDSKECGRDMADSDPSAARASSIGTETQKNELAVTEKQEMQNKITKLLTLLDEVDRRYRQYYHQMQIIVSSFDTLAGSGASKPYTALALQTISRHFRCLHDAINSQVHAMRKSLGEEDASSNDKGIGISRLRYVDKQLRQQRALQQLGVMQQHTWRPQRGLPETSVSILRAWLFEHFLHPYPKDSDKIMLARQTGLTRSQVANWFINARVRLWKPMVEEMYKEEAADAEMESNSSSETKPRTANTTNIKDQEEDLPNTSTPPEHFDLSSNVEMMGSETSPSFQNLLHSDPQSNRFMYHVSELERLGNNGGVSLTLGLQQCEGGGSTFGMNGGGTGHGFDPMRKSMGDETAEYGCDGLGNEQHEFVSSALESVTRLL